MRTYLISGENLKLRTHWQRQTGAPEIEVEACVKSLPPDEDWWLVQAKNYYEAKAHIRDVLAGVGGWPENLGKILQSGHS